MGSRLKAAECQGCRAVTQQGQCCEGSWTVALTGSCQLPAKPKSCHQLSEGQDASLLLQKAETCSCSGTRSSPATGCVASRYLGCCKAGAAVAPAKALAPRHLHQGAAAC